jgi:uncharacterized membrane protein YecN with MAPEG domain
VTIVSDSQAAVKRQILARNAGIVLAAERAREYADIHRSACRYRAQGLVCSFCFETEERAARLARLAGGAS